MQMVSVLGSYIIGNSYCVIKGEATHLAFAFVNVFLHPQRRCGGKEAARSPACNSISDEK